MSEDPVRRARAILREADEVLVLTGAGVSADSGVPTFRGEAGLWKRHRPEELATPEAFRRDPRLVWEWYAWRREIVRGCAPNAAHRALARWAAARDGVHIVTQNVDDLHGRAAGSRPASTPLELHGSLFRVRCTGCGRTTPHRDRIDATSEASLPRCDACGALLRPDVVWFGEPLPQEALTRARSVAERVGACLVVGTSAVVQPAAGLAVLAARSGPLIEVNPEPTPLSPRAAVVVRGGAAAILPTLLAPR